MVLLDCSASNQQTTLWRIRENGGQHKGTFRSGVHTVRVVLQRWSVCLCEVRWRRKRLSGMASPLESTNSSEWTNLLNQLLEPTVTSPDPRINIRQWNKNAEEYATRTGERVSDGIRRAVYTNKIAPQDMRQHLMLNQSRLSAAEEVAQESWRLLGCNRGVSRVMTRTKLVH